MNNSRITTLMVCFALFSGCSTTTVGYDGPCPLRPDLRPISAEIQEGSTQAILDLIDEDTDAARALRIQLIAEREASQQVEFIETAATNQLKLKAHIKDLEALSGCTQN